MKINIIYEDNHLIVCEKPVGILSQGDVTNDLCMLSLLKSYIKEKYNKPGDVYLGLVHRLDRMVGGIMVFAKTSKAASRLSEQIRNHTFKKTYLAVVHGKTKAQEILINYLYKDETKNIVKVVDETFNNAKKAILSYELIEHKHNLSLVKIDLETGRPHQIRVQFANIGNYLYGDKRYGNNFDKENIALFAYNLSFKHPTTKEKLHFTLQPHDVYPFNLFKL